MIVAIVQNGTIEQTGDLSVLFPNVSFPAAGPEPEWMAENGIVPVTYFKPYDAQIEKLVSVDPYLEGDAVYAVTVEPLTAGELAARNDSQWAKVRADRNKRLADCDWTQLSDAPLNSDQKADWATYRQALRDITNQTDPFNIIWPEQPTVTPLI